MRLLLLLAGAAALASGATYYVTIGGLGGEPEFQQRFDEQAKEIDKLIRATGETDVETLYGPAATKAKVEAALRSTAQSAKKDDALVVMLIGHGTFDGDNYKFNLPGPDITAGELGVLLDRIPASRQLVVNMTSSSGASLRQLERANRVVITATKSGTERNATVFARYWVEALRDPAADTDKNEVISALEAYRYAEQKTAKFYESANRLATEHPLLEDTGKGDGVRQPSTQNGHGLAAQQFTLIRIGQSTAAAKDPGKKALLEKREQIEQEIDKLKYDKAAMPADEYKSKLRALLIDLARTQAELDK